MFKRRWDKKAVFGLALLGFSYLLGALLKNAAQVSSIATPPGFRGACDTYVRSFCIPTFYLSLHLGTNLWFVINATSLLTSVAFFGFGVLFLRE
jgi:hypothetical protein